MKKFFLMNGVALSATGLYSTGAFAQNPKLLAASSVALRADAPVLFAPRHRKRAHRQHQLFHRRQHSDTLAADSEKVQRKTSRVSRKLRPLEAVKSDER